MTREKWNHDNIELSWHRLRDGISLEEMDAKSLQKLSEQEE